MQLFGMHAIFFDNLPSFCEKEPCPYRQCWFGYWLLTGPNLTTLVARGGKNTAFTLCRGSMLKNSTNRQKRVKLKIYYIDLLEKIS